MNVTWKRAVVPAISASVGVALAGACLAFSAALDQLLRIAFYRSVLVLTVVVTAGTVALLRSGESGSARAWIARMTARLRRRETEGAADWCDAARPSQCTLPAPGPIPARTLAALEKIRYVAWIDAAGPVSVCPPTIVAPVVTVARAVDTTSFRTAGTGGH